MRLRRTAGQKYRILPSADQNRKSQPEPNVFSEFSENHHGSPPAIRRSSEPTIRRTDGPAVRRSGDPAIRRLKAPNGRLAVAHAGRSSANARCGIRDAQAGDATETKNRRHNGRRRSNRHTALKRCVSPKSYSASPSTKRVKFAILISPPRFLATSAVYSDTLWSGFFT